MTSLKKLVSGVISEKKREGRRRGGEGDSNFTNHLSGLLLCPPSCYLSLFSLLTVWGERERGVGGRLRDAVEEGVAEKEFRCRNSVPFFCCCCCCLLRTYMALLVLYCTYMAVSILWYKLTYQMGAVGYFISVPFQL